MDSKKRLCQKPPKTFKLLHDTAIFNVTKLWQNGSTLQVQFLNYIYDADGNKVNDPKYVWASWEKAWIGYIITDTIMKYANLNFVFHLDLNNTGTLPPGITPDIIITKNPKGGAWSYVGTDCLNYSKPTDQSAPEPTMNLGWLDAPYDTPFTFQGASYTTGTGFDQGGYTNGLSGTIVHEFGHTVGMLHELQTPFGAPFTFNRDATYAYFAGPPNNWNSADTDSNVLDLIDRNQKNGSNFDKDSIMKYSFPCKLINETGPTICSYIEYTTEILSNCDKYWLGINYPGKPLVSCPLASNLWPVITPTPGPTPVPNPIISKLFPDKISFEYILLFLGIILVIASTLLFLFSII